LGFVDFRPLFPLGGMAPPAALAETVFRLAQPVIGARILLGSSGPFRLDLDGERLLMNQHEDRAALIDRWQRRVDLEAGEHRLRVVAARTPGDWGFFLRVVDATGRPLKLSDKP